MTKEYLKMADVFASDVESCQISGWKHQVKYVPLKTIQQYAAHAINSHDELVAENERLRELERDAERYRFLRECHWSESPLCVVVDPKTMVKLGADCPTTTRLDDAIDAVM